MSEQNNNGLKPSRRLKKAHIKSKEGVTVDYEVFNEHQKVWEKKPNPDMKDDPLDSFQESLDNLATIVRKYREEQSLDLGKYNVVSISLDYSSSEVPGGEAPYGVTIGATRSLGVGGPANCNTFKIPVVTKDDDAKLVLDNKEALLIEAAVGEAFRYLDGERKQLEADLNGEDDGKQPDLGISQDED